MTAPVLNNIVKVERQLLDLYSRSEILDRAGKGFTTQNYLFELRRIKDDSTNLVERVGLATLIDAIEEGVHTGLPLFTELDHDGFKMLCRDYYPNILDYTTLT
jgi:hypothetical protein